MRIRFGIALTAVVVATFAAPAWAQRKIIVPYPPASGPDILSRLMAEQIGRAQASTS